jgi:uncharacterized protein YciI
MQQFICLMRPAGTPRDAANYGSVFKEHGAYLIEMASKGHIFFAGYTDGEKPGELSLTVLNAENKDHAIKIMNAAPAVSAKLLSAQIEPFEVFVSEKFCSES